MGGREAQAEAKKYGLDLVEISPNARPPVCKILDYGKYKYEQSKKDKGNKKSASLNRLKELKFHLNIDSHDYEVKMKHAEQFLFKGQKVKIMMMLRGREMIRKQDAVELVKKVAVDLENCAIVDAAPKIVGRNVNMMLSPLPENKRSRKYTHEAEVLPEPEDSDEFEDSEAHHEDDQASQAETE